MSGARTAVVLPDVAEVRELVASLCFSRGGPLPDWDEVYEVHCGVEGDVIDERPDLECVLLSFANGNKYWYPAKALIMGNSDGDAPGTPESSTASTLPLRKPFDARKEVTLSYGVKHRVIDLARRFFADPSVRLDPKILDGVLATECPNVNPIKPGIEVEWYAGTETVLRHLQGKFADLRQRLMHLEQEQALTSNGKYHHHHQLQQQQQQQQYPSRTSPWVDSPAANGHGGGVAAFSAAAFSPPPVEPLPRAAELQYAKEVSQLTAELRTSRAILQKLRAQRSAELAQLERAAREDAPAATSPKTGAAALQEIAALVRAENEELRIELAAAHDGRAAGERDYNEIAQQCRQLEERTRVQFEQMNALRGELDAVVRRKEREAPLLDFKALRQASNLSSLLSKQRRASPHVQPPASARTRQSNRSITPPSTTRGISSASSNVSGMRRTATPPARRTHASPFVPLSRGRSLSPPNNDAAAAAAAGDRRVRRSDSQPARRSTSNSSRKLHHTFEVPPASRPVRVAPSQQAMAKRYERSATTGSIRAASSIPPPPPDNPSTSRTLTYDR
ncbi:hypothetical protein DIPPA_02568 [Diplonema papillatum]|nr:hypothetical protein DIPPA_27095 [Diplonema papillatum]KAJ9440169.1 hypothetical protein DIPPA_02568 [Diplonema papillatum]